MGDTITQLVIAFLIFDAVVFLTIVAIAFRKHRANREQRGTGGGGFFSGILWDSSDGGDGDGGGDGGNGD